MERERQRALHGQYDDQSGFNKLSTQHLECSTSGRELDDQRFVEDDGFPNTLLNAFRACRDRGVATDVGQSILRQIEEHLAGDEQTRNVMVWLGAEWTPQMAGFHSGGDSVKSREPGSSLEAEQSRSSSN